MAPELDFSWDNHKARLLAFGHDVNVTQPKEVQFWKGEDLNGWLMHDQKVRMHPSYLPTPFFLLFCHKCNNLELSHYTHYT